MYQIIKIQIDKIGFCVRRSSRFELNEKINCEVCLKFAFLIHLAKSNYIFYRYVEGPLFYIYLKHIE